MNSTNAGCPLCGGLVIVQQFGVGDTVISQSAYCNRCAVHLEPAAEGDGWRQLMPEKDAT